MALRARRRSLCGASTTKLVLVGLCSVVIWPCRMPMASCTTLTTGAKQLVVQDAAVTMRSRAGSYRWSFTPTTMLSTPPTFTGAATITRLAPLSRWPCKVSGVRNLPVHSSTRSTPMSPQGISLALACALKDRRCPSMCSASAPSASMLAFQRPCTESKLSKWAVAAAPPLSSLRCTTSKRLAARGSSVGRSTAPMAARRARRPMRPMPLMPTFMELILIIQRLLNYGVE